MNNTLQQSIDTVYKAAKNAGIKAEVVAMESDSSSLSYENKKLDELSTGVSLGIGVRFIKDNKECFFSTESLDTSDLEILCEQQIEALDYSKENPNIQLGNFHSIENDFEIDVPTAITNEQKADRILELDEALWSCDQRVKNIRGTGFSESRFTAFLFDSEQKNISYSKTSYGIWSEMLAQEGESLASGRYGQSKYDFDDLDSNEMLVKKVKDRSIGLLGAKSPETGSYPVVFDRKAFASILGLIIPMLKADTVDKGLSLFGDKVGEKIATGILHIEDNPMSLKGMGARPFDGEGSPSQKNILVGDGKLNCFLSNKEYADKMGIENTCNASRAGNGQVGISPSNILMRSGTLATSAIRAMKPKLVEVQNIMGLHAGFNSISGDFSFQAEGHLYEMGQMICPLQNFVVSGNIKDLLLKIEDVGAGLLDTGSSIVCPDVLVSSLKVVS